MMTKHECFCYSQFYARTQAQTHTHRENETVHLKKKFPLSLRFFSVSAADDVELSSTI